MAKVIVVMGVSGCGKTTIGKLLSKELNIPFFDGDDFHPESNISKMKKNIALTDANRKPWLEDLAIQLKLWSKTSGAVLACSSLKERYREVLSSQTKSIDWVFLSGTFETIRNRIEKRKGHYMTSELLQSQFNTLEIPQYGLHINILEAQEVIVEKIIKNIGSNA